MKSKTGSCTDLAHNRARRSLRETSLMRSRRRLGGGWPGSRQWWSPPTVKTSLIPTDGEGGLHLGCGDVFDKVLRRRPRRGWPVEADRGFHPTVDIHGEKREKGENKDDKWKWVSYGGSRQTKMRKSANKDETGNG
ncbi:hypothetical protein AAG906_004257 [Vitis piasezkii]